jgi:hypothetical protein
MRRTGLFLLREAQRAAAPLLLNEPPRNTRQLPAVPAAWRYPGSSPIIPQNPKIRQQRPRFARTSRGRSLRSLQSADAQRTRGQRDQRSKRGEEGAATPTRQP